MAEWLLLSLILMFSVQLILGLTKAVLGLWSDRIGRYGLEVLLQYVHDVSPDRLSKILSKMLVFVLNCTMFCLWPAWALLFCGTVLGLCGPPPVLTEGYVRLQTVENYTAPQITAKFSGAGNCEHDNDQTDYEESSTACSEVTRFLAVLPDCNTDSQLTLAGTSAPPGSHSCLQLESSSLTTSVPCCCSADGLCHFAVDQQQITTALGYIRESLPKEPRNLRLVLREANKKGEISLDVLQDSEEECAES